MSFMAAYVPVFTAVQDTLLKLQELQQVILGKNLKQIDTLDSLPIAVINTDLTKVTPTDTTSGYELKIPIIVDVVIVEYETETWFEKMSQVMGAIVDALLSNPTLGGAVSDLLFNSYAPGTITFQDAVYYGGEIRFLATLNYTAS
jgi:hypothetical protein